MGEKLPVFDLGLAPYGPVQALQRQLRREVVDGRGPGALLLLEHPPVITLGSRGTDRDIVGSPPPAVEIVRSERGGAATLHAPGQLISYAVMRLPGRDLRAFVKGLEEVLVRITRDYGIAAARSEGRPGLYVEDRKIASVGLRCERWVASHGTSLNVDVDLSLFDHIVSCAEVGLRQTDIATLLGRAPAMDEVKERYVRHFAKVFSVTPAARVRRLDVEGVRAELSLPSPAP